MRNGISYNFIVRFTINTITHYNLVHPPRRMYNADRVAVIVQKPQAHWTITVLVPIYRDTVSV